MESGGKTAMRFWLPAVRRLSLCVSPFPAASSTTALVLATLCSSQAADPLPKRLGEPLSESAAFRTDAAAPTPDFQSLRIKGLIVALPGPQDTIDPDLAGIRSSLAALGIVGPEGADLLYFAFGNCTTLGYGDVTPVKHWSMLGP